MSEDPSPGRDAVLEVGAVTLALLMLLSVTAAVSLSAPPPLAAVAGDDVVVDVGQTVAFNGTASTGAAPLQFLWFFGNGDAELGGLPSFADETEAEFAYSREGVYEAILILTDGLGRTDVDTRVVTVRNVLPMAVIAVAGERVESLEVEEDEVVAFDGFASEDTEPLSYHWSFGDGEEGDGVEVEHAYTAAGTYVARLEVMDSQGARNRSAVVVEVINVDPVAVASFPTGAAEDETVTLDASATFDTPSDLPELDYVWDLGDGTVELGRVVQHAYALAGTYDVRLTVVDDNGTASTVEGSLTVTNEPPMAVTDQLLVAEEGATVFFDASASKDTPSDLPVLGVAWDFDLDGETDARGFQATHVFADEGTHFVDVDVTDDDGDGDANGPRVDVANVAPSAGILGAFRIVDVNLTVAGTPGHTVTITIHEGPAVLAQGSSTRRATDPAEHRVVFDDLRFALAEDFVAVVEYEPLLDELGDNPAWLNLTYEDGTSVSLFHNFNAVQEETHLWTVDLDPLLTELPVHLVGYAYDPGADDLTLRWDLGDGRTHVFDHGSDGVPTRVTHEVVHAFGFGTFVVTFEAEDEDGGLGQDEAVVTSSEDGLFIDNVRPRAELGGLMQGVEDEALSFAALGQDTASDREDLSYVWIFRDGSQAVGPVAEHAFAQSGTYHVLLVVKDPQGEDTVDSVRVDVENPPPIAALGPVDSAEEDQLVTFDASVTADTPSDQSALRYRWDFGDGAVGVGAVALHSYPRAGTYTVTLVVQDDNGAFASVTDDIEVANRVPTADFDGPAEAFVEEPAPFVSSSEDTPADAALLDLAWAVDDAQVSGRTLIVTGLTPTEITVDLTVTDNDGAADDASKTLLVKNRPPEAHIPFDAFFVYGEQPEAAFRGLAFDTLDDQQALIFAWSFGDGSTAAGATAAHTYGTSGSFTLTLTATDSHGVVGVDTAVVNVILDADRDGLPDLYESDVSETDPTSTDSDGDGILDSVEVLVLGTDPLLQDTDFDAWTDFEEVFAVHGYMTKPLVADSDEDGIPDGSELYTQAFRTTERFAVPDGGSVTVPLFNVASAAPSFTVERADARFGVVHPRAGNLTVLIVRNGVNATASVPFPDAPNLFVSVDLLEAGFTPIQLTTNGTWKLEIDNAGDRGTVEYFEIHIAARTSPVADDSDGDGLNDTEETNPGDDGWITDPWRSDTDGDAISDSLEVEGWKRVGLGFGADPNGFRTDPTRKDTERDGFPDNDDFDPLHDLMIQVTVGQYEALDNDPDLDDCTLTGCQPWPEPFIEVRHRGKSLYTPHKDPQGMSATFNNAYALDVPDDNPSTFVTFRAWDDDPLADKEWDLNNETTQLRVTVFFPVLSGTTDDQTLSGAGSDGNEESCGGLFPDPNACRDASLTYRIDTVRAGPAHTLLVDALDTDDLLETPSGNLRYLGDDVFYIAWLDVTSTAGRFEQGLNAVLVPRAQFFNSSVNHTLQTADGADDLPGYLTGLTFTAFNESAAQTTKSIAGMLNGTLSGVRANQLLQALTEGPDDVINGNVTVVTDELVTLGLSDTVLDALPWVGVRFDETGAGPGTLVSEIIGGAVGFLVQGLVLIGTAIADFFVEAAAFLKGLGLAIIGAIGTFFGLVKQRVVEAGEVLSGLLDWLVGWAVGLLLASVEGVLTAASDVTTGIVTAARNAATEVWNDSLSGEGISETSAASFANALLSLPALLLLGSLSATVVISVAVVGSALLPFGFLIAIVAAAVIFAIIIGITGQDIILQTPPLSPPTSFDFSPGGLFEATQVYLDTTEEALGGSSHLSDTWTAVAGAFDALAIALAVIFLVGNADLTGIGSLLVGLTFSIFAAVVAADLVASVPEELRGPVEWIIGITLVMIAILSVSVTLIGLARALIIDPTGIKYLPIAFMSIIAALGGILFSLKALNVLP